MSLSFVNGSSYETGEMTATSASEQELLDQADELLLDPTFFGKGNPFPLYEALRRHTPVRWTKHPNGRGYWQVTSFAEAEIVLSDARTFSSGLSGDVLPVDLNPEYTTREMGVDQIMAWTDGPRHAEMRSVLNRPFSPRSLGQLENVIRKIVREMLTHALDRDEGDFGWELFQIPLRVVMPLIGAPEEDTDEVYHMMMKAVLPAELPDASDLSAIQRDGMTALIEYSRGMVKERLARPTEDLVGVLTSGQDGMGQPFDPERMAWNVTSFLIAGFDTTAYTMTGGVLALIENPEQLAALRSDRSLIRSAIEESVRWVSPFVNNMRTAALDTELAGQKIRAGDWVSVATPACNRDPQVFDKPYRFDVKRSANRHLGFGRGVHTCVGNHLARLEVRIFLEELLDMVDEIELTGRPAYANSNQVWGVRHLPVRLKPA